MATKIYVSQIDTANSTGGQAAANSFLIVGNNGPEWSNVSIFELYGVDPNELVGYTGSTGFTGSIGSTGYAGSIGYRGSLGSDGPQGAVGYTGSAGAGYTGSTGSVGYQGSEGTVGYRGSLGATGYTGSAGSTGFTGSLGTTGYFGSTGFRGSVGFMGSSGSMIFTNILDVPQSYTGYANGFVRVNQNANGIIFDTNTYITANIATSLSLSGNTILNPSFKSFSEVVATKGNSTSTVVIDIRDGNVQTTTLNAAIVDLVLETAGLISGKMYTVTLFIKQDATGGRIIDWSNQTVYWPTAEGTYDATYGPSLSTTANYTDIITLTTLNAGSTWYGFLSGKGFATT